MHKLRGIRAMNEQPQRARAKKHHFMLAGFAALILVACNQQQASAPAAATANAGGGERKVTPPGGHPLSEGVAEDEYGEFVAKAEELVNVPSNEIVKSIRL